MASKEAEKWLEGYRVQFAHRMLYSDTVARDAFDAGRESLLEENRKLREALIAVNQDLRLYQQDRSRIQIGPYACHLVEMALDAHPTPAPASGDPAARKRD